MLNQSEKSLVVFIIVVITLLALIAVFIVVLIYRYQKRQIAFLKEMEELKITHANTLLQSQLEMQEQTFQHIAREIHDNIGQRLTLAKLYLNTLTYVDRDSTISSVDSSLELITESIEGLSDISRSMSTELVLQNGLVKGIEMEARNVNKTGIYQVEFNINGVEIFLSGNAELVIFRIVQECMNNFLKHGRGTHIEITLNYTSKLLNLEIRDNGKGFDVNKTQPGSGLLNIRKRAAMLKGKSDIKSNSTGTTININIPINENTEHANTYPG